LLGTVPSVKRILDGAPIDADGLQGLLAAFDGARPREIPTYRLLRVGLGNDTWDFEETSEFLQECATGASAVELVVEYEPDALRLEHDGSRTTLTVTLPTRADIERVLRTLPPPRPTPNPPSAGPCVFLGHGKGQEWRVLSDHLKDQGYTVLTYENSSVPGQPALEVLGELAGRVDAAIVVHTAEVVGAGKRAFAGPNVVHETGYFQAELGPRRVLILREHSCDRFANIGGLTEVAFTKDDVAAVVGAAVTLLRRMLSAV
jgi:hypothetical protein